MLRLKFLIAICFVGIGVAQAQSDSVLLASVKQTVHYLSQDSLEGRGNYTISLHKAARYIKQRFLDAGLQPFNGEQFFQYHSLHNQKKEQDSSQTVLAKDILVNVVGWLPGISKQSEIVIFSAHFDHVGIQEGVVYNGANDNASGIAALLALAEYFGKQQSHQRTLLFCAFSGEELGLLGSNAFLPFIEPDSVVAVINIEMVGKAQFGKGNFFITGAHHSNLQAIFRQNLKGKARIVTEPDAKKNLFFRSDNLPFAQHGIPAHTVMSSDDSEPCYHQPCDDAKQINYENIVAVVKAIAEGSSTIIRGKDTPRRLKKI